MKQDIENIIKNLPKYKNGSKAIPKDDIVVQYSALSLIAYEVLKVVVEKIETLRERGFMNTSTSNPASVYRQALDDIINLLKR